MKTRQEATDAAFVTVSVEDQGNQEKMRLLRAEAERTGKMLVNAPRQSVHSAALEEHAASVAAGRLKVVPAGDKQAFLDNLDALASGRAVVG